MKDEMNNMSILTASQLDKIINFLPYEQKVKIPENILEFIKNKSSNIDTNINKIEDINEKNVSSETRKYLSLIFLNYLASKSEKEEYIKILKRNEEHHQIYLSKKYNIDNIFNKRKLNNIKPINNLPIPKKEGLFEHIINFIKKLFSK